ncbi:MAG TPA: hypothetical protein PKE45_09295, partial [Caldilineaceae bacterium]|nr:hypothetical protein [Caldilineaceae bacterium]
MATRRTDYDSPWKEVLERYFESFVAFFFPQAHGDIDWSRGYEFLDKELQQVVREAEHGRQMVDKLVKVWLKDGTETWLLIHVEVQGQVETDFARRMFTYNYRLFDRYGVEVVSIAVLADEDAHWRPNEYRYGRWGGEHRLQFLTVKLLDFATTWSELEQNRNPFAVVVMAHLKTQATRRRFKDRLQWKIDLVKGLYIRGYKRTDILELFRFIDWLMV